MGIYDPWYTDYSQLGQHNKPLLSLVRFNPSFTDQSYFVVNIIGKAKIYLKGKRQNVSSKQWQEIDLYKPETNQIVGKQLLVVKPHTDNYQLTLIPESEETEFSAFFYNQQADVATYADKQLPLTEKTVIEFDYDKESETDFFRLTGQESEIEPPVEPEVEMTWEQVPTRDDWQYRFIQWVSEEWYQQGAWVMMENYLADFKARLLLSEDLLTLIQSYLQRLLGNDGG